MQPMMNAAYAASVPRPHPVAVARKHATVCYSVVADADPGMLARVLEPVAKRGRVPDRLNAVREEEGRGPLVIDLQVRGLDEQGRDVIAGVLSQIVGVHRVLMCDKAG